MAGNSKLSALAARIGLGRRDSDLDDHGAHHSGDLGRLAREGREALLASIAGFILDNDLPIRPQTLISAYNALSGASPALARQIEARHAGGEPITLPWLIEVDTPPVDHIAAADPSRLLMDEFDTTLEQFSEHTRAVRSMTSEYGSELDRHLLDLERIRQDVDVVAQLALLAKKMAERTRHAEIELRTRDQETKTLRRRLDEAKRDADQDHLTGLPNRRAFEAKLARDWDLAKETGEPLSLAFVDLDHFKLVNDRHGHDTGDRVLKLVANELAAASEEGCHVARHGGEEFVVLFRNHSPALAKARLDKVRETLARRRLVNRESGEPIGTVTFSAGVADVFAYEDPREALRAADEALYKAKDSGRNHVLLAGAVPDGDGEPIRLAG